MQKTTQHHPQESSMQYPINFASCSTQLSKPSTHLIHPALLPKTSTTIHSPFPLPIPLMAPNAKTLSGKTTNERVWRSQTSWRTMLRPAVDTKVCAPQKTPKLASDSFEKSLLGANKRMRTRASYLRISSCIPDF